MNNFTSFFNFVVERKSQIMDLFIQHIQLTLFSIIIAIIIAIPLGILIVRYRKLSVPIIGVTNVIQSIPSLALLGFLIPALGIGSKPAIIMVVMYSLLPIVKNTFTGLTNVSPALIEAADGMGLTNTQVLLKVRFPLAMPIIMSGIRISSVTAVGLMTIAAFIGAGGLGYLVFSGVQTVDNNMILAGAIPACILAIVLDFVLGKIENIVVPEGIKVTHSKNSKRKGFFGSKKFKLITSGIVLLVILSTVATSFINDKNKIVVGSKNFNEQLVLGDMVSSLIEAKTKYKVERKLNLGGTNVVFSALKSKDVDLYVEYTGTVLVNMLKQPTMSDPKKVYDTGKATLAEKYGIEMLKPIGFNNTYVLAVKKDFAKKNNLETISDLAKISPTVTAGVTMDFANRQDGYLGLQKKYNLKFKSQKGIDGGLRYTALKNNETQVLDAFSTDGLIKKFDLKLLKDDKAFFPPYYAVSLVNADTLKKYPELKGVLSTLDGKINDDEMRAMNLKVDNGAQSKTVAEDFLRSKHLID
ncbi:ABC transporter permease/substrate-binding protein [Clostridium estertheticum]|uniref:ABC transporter permease n=1 Tax=Clostridium estertheticum subsp. estertheticum TaxID=1552 RepID=A0A1J0GMQ4_9CLOT|nr:glycine betaine ABC transporter substrate-binding protein [Clostridium estertheticum]APC42200.1 ABC transporter permease [Clostridium estertheticum subsp. estertheticum]MBU3073711.1 ABC transporter permease subunit [Clostridium estertheticum]MBU3163804.1 ABC transporter permease subunit [Clostridium estertheticum]MBU3172383.1 ABC transporter permease subunit [Clostridium estertheticum]MBU3184226.1 ABC transporter permease subunit [Clostridium estertheticum]